MIRISGWKLGHRLSRSLRISPADWIHRSCEPGAAVLDNKAWSTKVRIQTCCCRLLDRVYVIHDGCDVWIPLWSRIWLRHAARAWLIERALGNAVDYHQAVYAQEEEEEHELPEGIDLLGEENET